VQWTTDVTWWVAVAWACSAFLLGVIVGRMGTWIRLAQVDAKLRAITVYLDSSFVDDTVPTVWVVSELTKVIQRDLR